MFSIFNKKNKKELRRAGEESKSKCQSKSKS